MEDGFLLIFISVLVFHRNKSQKTVKTKLKRNIAVVFKKQYLILNKTFQTLFSCPVTVPLKAPAWEESLG